MMTPLAPTAVLAALCALLPPGATSGPPAQIPTAPERDEYAPPQTEWPIEFAFGSGLIPYRGIESLEHMRGRPVFVAYWWMDSVEAGEVLRSMLTRLAPFEEDIEILLCESSERSDLDHQSFLWDIGALSTTAHAFRGDPVPRNWHAFQGFILDETGRVSWWGRLDDPFEEALKESIAMARDEPSATDVGVAKGWKAFFAGDWKKAHKVGSIARKNGLREIERGELPPEGELDLLTQGEILIQAVEGRHLALCDRVERLFAAGRPALAARWLEFLEDRGELPAKRCAKAEKELVDRTRKRDLKESIAADRELEAILAVAAGSLAEGGDLYGQEAALRSFLEAHGEGPLAPRVRALLELIEQP